MSYLSLRERFYRDASNDRFAENQRLANERRNAESTFRTGIVSPSGELFLAVPRELSLINEKVLRYERHISQLARDLPPVAYGAMVRSLIASEVVSTNDMEGVHSTRRQISDLLSSMSLEKSARRSRFSELAKLYLGISDPGRAFPKTPEDVRRIYDLVMEGEDLGQNKPDGKLFRKGGVEVWGPGGKRLHEGLYPEAAIVEGITKMLSIVDSEDIPETYSAIIGHYIFECIHPFYDGNGRTGRYLLALYLSRPLSSLTTLSLSSVIAERRSAYYKSFSEVENELNHGELTGFVLNMLENVQEAQAELAVGLETRRGQLSKAEVGLGALQSRFGFTEKESGVLYLLIQTDLFGAFPDVTLSEIAEYSGVKSQQARNYTKALLETGVIESFRSREIHFQLTDFGRSLLGMN